MRQIKTLIILLFIAFGNQVYSQWLQQFNNNGDWTLTVDFVDSDTGFVGTTLGYIFKTVDGGTTWNSQYIGSQTSISDLYFYNSDVGYAVGNNSKIYKTTDGGVGWTESIGIPTDDYRSINCPNIDTCFVCGTKNILKTVNGGDSWQTMYTSLIQSEYFHALDFVNSDYGFVTGSKTFKTIDGGLNWNEVADKYNIEIDFYSENIGYAISRYDTIRKTIDGGNTWNDIIVGSGIAFDDFQVLSEDIVFLACTSEVFNVIRTIDGGNTFYNTQFTQFGLNGISMLNSNEGWTVGINGIYHAENAGSLGLMLGVESPNFNSLTNQNKIFPNPTTGQILIDNPYLEYVEIYNLSGVLIKATDKQEIDLSQEPKGIYFIKVYTKYGVINEKIVLE